MQIGAIGSVGGDISVGPEEQKTVGSNFSSCGQDENRARTVVQRVARQVSSFRPGVVKLEPIFGIVVGWIDERRTIAGHPLIDEDGGRRIGSARGTAEQYFAIKD